jgi:hypothetical protein
MQTLPVTITTEAPGAFVYVTVRTANGAEVFTAKTKNSYGFVKRLDRALVKGGVHRATGYDNAGRTMVAEGVFYPEAAAL